MRWFLGKNKHRQAGQRVGDAEKHLRFCQQMKALEHRKTAIMMSDEKIFAMSELHVLLVEDESGKWPARSPDLNWLDEFVWGLMVNEIRFEEATTKDELKAAILRVWAKITPQMCRNMITHYWKSGGTLDKCIAAEGKRFSKPKLAEVVDDD